MLKTVGRIRLVSELASDPWTTTRAATGEDGAPVIVRLGKVPVRLGPEDEARFAAEAQQTRTLGEHVAPVMSHGVSFSIPWIVHPTLTGRPLAALLAEDPEPLAPDLVALIGVDVAAALDAAHRCEPVLLHRAISLDSLWLDARGPKVCVVGYVLARVCLDAARAIPPMRDAARSFAAPEHVRGQPLGPGADLFALGATLLALATGETRDAATLAGDLAPLSAMPTGLREALARVLSIDPAARGTAAELGATLRGAIGDEGPTRAALAARFGLERAQDTERPPAPDGAPTLGMPLDSVTKEQLLPEAMASYRAYHPLDDPLSSTDPIDPLDDELDFDALLREAAYAEDPAARGDTAETSLPAGTFDEMPTFVEANRRDAETEIGVDVSGDAPLERTVELPLPESRPRVPERITDAPALPASTFEFRRPETPLQRLARVEVQGWPLTWLVGLGVGAVAMVVLVAFLTALIAG